MLTLPATLYHAQTFSSANWLAHARSQQWQIDGSALQAFDSSALALLLELQRVASLEQKSLQIHNAPAKLSQLATLYGVAELLRLV